MKGSQNFISTESTLQSSRVQFFQSNLILPSANQLMSASPSKKYCERTVSILTEDLVKNTNLMSSFKQSNNMNTNLRKNQQVVHICQFHQSTNDLSMVLSKIFFKKKRYCFQVLKQFYLFPDETQSSIMSMSTYDPLIFQDQIIHSLVKILETKSIQNKIWGFINLRMMPYLKAAVQIEQKATQVYQKTIRFQKKVSFDMIKKVSQEAFSAIMRESNFIHSNVRVQTQCKQIQCSTVEQRSQKKQNRLSSRLVQQQLQPMIIIKTENVENKNRNTTRVLTIEEYNQKYKVSRSDEQRYHPRVIRISANDYSQTVLQTKTPQIEVPQVIIPQVRITQTRSPQIRYIERQQRTACHHQEPKMTKQKIKKFNIIHYHEKQRLIVQPATSFQRANSCCDNSQYQCGRLHQCTVKNSLQLNISCCSNHKACMNRQCCPYQGQKREQCLSSRVQKYDIINETVATQRVTLNQGKQNSYDKLKKNATYELSQLQSRIEYLNFLRKVVQEQQEQQVS